MKKKIALIIDSEGWAFDNIAKQIKKNIEKYDFDIIPGRIFEGNMLKLFLYCQDYDAIHFLWRGYLSLTDSESNRYYAENVLYMDFKEFESRFIKNKKISFSVCDHLYLEGEEKWRTEKIFKYSNMYFVTSEKLYDIYNNFDIKPKTIINDGVDLIKFAPNNLKRLEDPQKIIFGWVGNSKFTDSLGDTDLKGVETIIKPAIEELRQEGFDIELKLADRNIKKISQEDMPNFYNSIHAYICASKTEGTPLTVLEAMAMGLPIISTDVGIVKEAFGNLQSKYILEERTKECLKEKIKLMIANKDELKKISNENLIEVKKFDWKNVCEKFKSFIEENIEDECKKGV